MIEYKIDNTERIWLNQSIKMSIKCQQLTPGTKIGVGPGFGRGITCPSFPLLLSLLCSPDFPDPDLDAFHFWEALELFEALEWSFFPLNELFFPFDALWSFKFLLESRYLFKW